MIFANYQTCSEVRAQLGARQMAAADRMRKVILLGAFDTVPATGKVRFRTITIYGRIWTCAVKTYGGDLVFSFFTPGALERRQVSVLAENTPLWTMPVVVIDGSWYPPAMEFARFNAAAERIQTMRRAEML